MDSSVPPAMQHCRNVSNAMYDNLKEGLRDRDVKDIVGSVDKPTDWVHNLVIVSFASVIGAFLSTIVIGRYSYGA